MDRSARLDDLCRRYGVMALYLFGSRAADGRQLLDDPEAVRNPGSDLDLGVFFVRGQLNPAQLGRLQVELEEVFAPLQIDLVPLDRVDPLFQFNAISGCRASAPDSRAADENELLVMRRAADLLPIQHQIEIDRFGVATT